jgi:hypothetical protein
MCRSILFILASMSIACAGEVPLDYCSEDFRDQWWAVETEVTDDHNIAQTCFYVGSDGYMETVHYDSKFSMESKWTCTGANDLRIKGRGSATFYATEFADIWEVDLNLTIPPLNDTSTVEPCWWNE